MAEKLHRIPVKLFFFGGAAVPVIAGAFGWLLWPEKAVPTSKELPLAAREEAPAWQPPSDPSVPASIVIAGNEPEKPETKSTRSFSPASPAAAWIGKSAENLTPPHLPLTRGATPSDAQIDSILQENIPEHTKAERLLQRLPFLPEEAYARATEEAVQRLRDRDYPRLVRPLIIQPGTHGAIMSVLFADLLERPDEIAIPTLADIADQPEHPFSKSAEDDLDLLVDKKQPGWAERIAHMRAALKYKPAEIVE